ncbi:uncharacterized protein RHIMIDRAFT_41588 [Rhizopus microsporus ATCC 52813]|uniref:Uncharacterized protein n=1 Tax=Rhizopus microsporus ATCC 52813 TaxID=1340429 RepID=A0A2G4SNP4_RHIZD|nr:uncharacterized protein RHIMIDRAFT_41588 [Rhizopus microsporus ATCC 52813]PHZ10006.1 hypothetical protein RHIMIDRAFT_41588 [Rhizopus microsporus ATCC 52813]
MKYICYRVGTYKSRVGVQTEDESSKSRPIQKPSKKIDCRCYVTVTCYFLEPNVIFVKDKVLSRKGQWDKRIVCLSKCPIDLYMVIDT